MRTCPLRAPLPSFRGAPIATTVPSEERLTEYPDRSEAASPSISLPT